MGVHTVLICHVIVSKTTVVWSIYWIARVVYLVADVDSRYGTDERAQR
jgi:hypothetical protein